MSRPATVSARDARRLLLGAQGLLDDPERPAAPARVLRQIERLGYVQVDTINVVVRAHHHILMSRFDGYRPTTLERLLERDRALFEQWTHDASVIPTVWFEHWRPRFAFYKQRMHPEKSRWAARFGPEPRKLIARVRSRIRREGPLSTRDFEDDQTGRGSFWNWKPSKVALEYLWRTGELSISRRDGFQKVYDLTKRVLPQTVGLRTPPRAAHVEWACRTALERLGCATPTELRDFLYAVGLDEVKAWCVRAERSADIVKVMVEGQGDTKPSPAYALPDWQRRARACPDPPRRMRLLSPFEPTLPDRKPAQRLFGFDYRFEGFVPPSKRQYGYYVLPLLEGERFVGRADARLQRDQDRLEILSLHWEPGVAPSAARRRALERASALFASQIDATSHRLPKQAAPGDGP